MEIYKDIKIEDISDSGVTSNLGKRILISNIHGYNLVKTLECGQVFRFKRVNNTYLIHSKDRVIRVRQADADHLVMDGTIGSVKEYWLGYLGLLDNYDKILEIVRCSEYRDNKFILDALDVGSGIKILHQDLWESMVSFIISQRNNIPKIQSTIERICEANGNRRVNGFSGIEYNAFPTPIELLKCIQNNHGNLGLGYREEYLEELALGIVEGEIDLGYISKLNYGDAMKYLLSIKGIGVKVANCISLFSLGHTGAFPIDVWIQRVIDDEFNGSINSECFGEYAGIIQQYLFYTKRRLRK